MSANHAASQKAISRNKRAVFLPKLFRQKTPLITQRHMFFLFLFTFCDKLYLFSLLRFGAYHCPVGERIRTGTMRPDFWRATQLFSVRFASPSKIEYVGRYLIRIPNRPVLWARSAAGSASHSHCGGREFESPRVHQMDIGRTSIFSKAVSP